ncbi:MAG: hypothetical protein ACE5EX_00635 [Phycisphaerae bacterium]
MMTTLSVDAHRQSLLHKLQHGHAYEFLTLAARYLEACPDDQYIRLMTIREYLKLALIAPARELLGGFGAAGEVSDEVGALRRTVFTLTGGGVSWSDYTERFEANLTALGRRGFDTTPVADAWAERAAHFECHRDANGVDQIRMRLAGASGHEGTTGGVWRWIPFLGHHRAVADAQPLPQGMDTPTPGPYVFEGIDLGWYFHRVYTATRDTFLGYGCPLFVVEPEPALLALVFHLHDWAELLADPRVFWFTGPECVQRLAATLTDDPDLPWPRQAFSMSVFRPGGSPGAAAAVQAAMQTHESVIEESYRDLETRYASRDCRYWAKRFEDALSGRAAPLRILAAVSTHTTFLQYSMRDAKRAFEALGHRCTVLSEKNSYSQIGHLTYHNAIRELDPDIFFSLDHIRPEFVGLIPAGLPVLTWDQDQLPQVFTPENTAAIGAADFVAGWAKPKCVAGGCDPRQFLYACVPTCPEQFSGPSLTDAERERYACDVSYVSHASQTPREFHEAERKACQDPALRRLLDALYELTPDKLAVHGAMGRGLPDEILAEASRRCGVMVGDKGVRDRLTGWYLWRLADRLFRHEALEWVAKWARSTRRNFRIYGNGWENHATLSEFAAGPAGNGRELVCVYRASKINVQLMPAGFIHQRALDGLAAGGFFLARRTPADTQGLVLRKLTGRMAELGITRTLELLDTTDTTLRGLLEEYLGPWLATVDRNTEDLINNVRILAELQHPDEVFPDFDDILFDSASGFAAAADRFLADEELRRNHVDSMRTIVIEKFSYRAEMKRFLQAMADYLREAAP